MNNLYRELAPVSAAAWAEIEEEARRTLKRHLAARRVVDVEGPKGFDFAGVGTGHTQGIPAPGEGVQAVRREVKTLVELRVPFELARQAVDDVERGAEDSDWSSVKEAARKLAFAEDNSVFEGYDAAGIQGIRQGTSNPVLTLPSNVRSYPDVVAQAVSQLRLAGVNGPYALVLGQRRQRRRLSCPSAYPAAYRWGDHLGAGNQGWFCGLHPRGRFRIGSGSGHIHRLS